MIQWYLFIVRPTGTLWSASMTRSWNHRAKSVCASRTAA